MNCLLLSHHHADREIVDRLGRLLAERGIGIGSTRETAPAAWKQAQAMAVCLGMHGLDQRQKREIGQALAWQAEAEQAGQDFPIIPVLLPGADLPPAFLFRQAWVDLRHNLADPAGLDRLAEAASTGAAPLRSFATLIDLCPYPGPRPFREEEAAFFCGREAAAARLLDKIRQHNLMALIGPPASGKTSLIQAGLLPLLRDEGGKRKDENFDSPFILHPSSFILSFRPGRQPFHRLAAALTDLLSPDLSQVERLAAIRRLGGQLARGETRLEQLIEPALAQAGADHLLLIVDQFEELLTLTPAPQRRPWLEAVLAALAHPQLTVLLSLRADFYNQTIQLSPALSRLLEGSVVHLEPLTRAELEQAMLKPARLITLAFEPGLVERLSAAVAAAPGSLLVLQCALVELWRQHQGGLLRHTFYDHFGGAPGVVSYRAEQVFQSLTAHQQELVRRALVRLVASQSEGPVMCRPLGLTQLATSLEVNAHGPFRVVLATLAEAQLLTLRRDPVTARPTVEVAQAALVSHWPRWQAWLNEAAEFRLWRGRLGEAMVGWERAEPGKQSLLQGAALSEAEHWLTQRREWLDSEGWIFIWHSLARWRWERDLRGLMSLGVVLLLIIGLVLLLAQQHATLATLHQERNVAWAAQAQAEASRQAAATAQVIAEDQRFEVEQQRQAMLARALVAQAQIMPAEALQQSTLLALESLRRLPEGAGERVLHRNLALLPRLITQIRTDMGVNALAFSPDGRHLVTANGQEALRQWQVENGREIMEAGQPGEVIPATLSQPGGGLLVEPASAGRPRQAPIMVFSPDGRWAAAGDWAGKVRVWEAASGRLVAELVLDDHITALAFSPGPQQGRPDGWLAAGGWGGRVWLWRLIHEPVRPLTAGIALLRPSLLGAKPEAVVAAHRDVVLALTFSPDGRQLASASADNTAKVWSLSTVLTSGALMPPVLGGGVYEVAQLAHGASVWSVAFSPNGRWLATGSADRTARLWDISTGAGQERGRLAHPDDVKTVLFSPNGLWLATISSDDTARIWLAALGRKGEAAGGRNVAQMRHAGPIYALAFSPDSHWLATVSADNTARVWEAATGREVAQMSHDDDVTAVVFNPALTAQTERHWLATASRDGSTRIWEVAPGPEINQLQQPDWILGLHFSPDGQWLAARSRFVVQAWGATSDRPIAHMEHDAWIISASFSPDGYWLATGSRDKTARLWQTATGQEVAKLDHAGPVHLVLFSPNGRQLATVSNDNIVRLWQTGATLSTGTAVGPRVIQLPHQRWIDAVAFSPAGRWLATASRDHRARLWETHTGREISRLSHMGGVLDVVFSPDGRWLATASADHTARLWDMTTNREVTRLPHEGRVEAVLFSADGRWLASRSGTEVWLWKVAQVLTTRIATDQQTARLRHEESVRAIAFSPDGHWLATSTGNPPGTGAVWLWEVATGQEITHSAYDNWVNAVAFSPDGRWLVSGGGDRLARVWLVQPEDLIDEACARLTRNLTRSEWQQYLGEEPYRPTCPNLPFEN